jgi:hypothetical protein
MDSGSMHRQSTHTLFAAAFIMQLKCSMYNMLTFFCKLNNHHTREAVFVQLLAFLVRILYASLLKALDIQKFVRPANAENLLLNSTNALISKLKILMRRLPRKLNRQKFSQLKLMMRGGVQSVCY